MRFSWERTALAAALYFIAAVSFSNLRAADKEPLPSKLDNSATTSATPEAKSNVVENSVVKVFSTVRYPDYFRPWTKLSPSEITGSGVVIEGKRILSNAHVVLYAS